MTDFLEPASNPIAPDAFRTADELQHQKLSNSDFRKLLMTPKPVPTTAAPDNTPKTNPPDSTRRTTDQSAETKDRDHGSRHKSKRHFGRPRRDHAKEHPTEPSQHYRDRAKERREGKLVAPVDEGDEREFENDEEVLSRTADYRAVAPSTSAGASLAERRRMIIQESKYLGGDMEHTHLVKGLDYVLLQKVRLEIQNKELEVDQMLDSELSKPEVTKEQPAEEGLHLRTKLATNIVDFLFNEHPTERNEYFQPGRMAYRIELEDDSVDFEVPATVIRSKSDVLQMDGRGQAAITTNEIVINKLTQILSYLRAGKRHAKKAKMKGHFADAKEEMLYGSDSTHHHSGGRKSNAGGCVGGNIFDDVGAEYIPTSRRSRNTDGTDHSKANNTESSTRDKPSSYFADVSNEPEGQNVGDSTGPVGGGSLNAAKEFMQELNQRFAPKDDDKVQDKASLERFFAKTKVTCYDECYPGFAESYDAMGDSDDEADFSKMDLGSKKGPVGRWDFETQEEYSSYMSNKEALPKAAFQYGVKMVDGRKTRRLGTRDEKAELDRQLQKIQSIIHKRKQFAEDAAHPSSKNPRY